MSRKYKFHNKSGVYFISFATVYWIDIFTRQAYFNILEESITHCRKEKAMQVFAYCFMPNHVHLIFRSTDENPSGLLRDFKGFTARKLIKMIEENPQESRKEWLLWMLKRAGSKNSNVKKYQLWQQHNKPIELWSEKVIQQKIDYIHNNPIESGFVTNPVDWKYSSARNYQGDQTVLEIDI
ncbi:REP-associated tyrosine transposase [Tenacibaculum piscium]|uniref:Transposase n=1 Tax=Tenacibaculum piscium TaxID=1458515 RepID=A0A2H1YI84_9FLAO|nr:transposase [Tenacibaculum piscium]MBE7629889.1 transposase [Tenacibaculum piscium]MBE7670301.1 transposase [Tenacibaculum piscium]MBE7685847.1 transposase [Tenacibaculum piscium]MBE7690453.1 transposase [Tenacibaculum piscium]SOS75101.1 transposase [Tenacibaculum piscium]